MLIILNGGWDDFDINYLIIDTYLNCSHVSVPDIFIDPNCE